MNNLSIILESLNEKQQEVCKSDSNIILTACPGSGKTRVITHRLAYLSEKHKESYKYNIAITYTNRAAKEIENRIEDMGVDIKSIWTGTIHQFCMHFIIRPYSMYHHRLSRGYKIIDEYVKVKYFKYLADKLNVSYRFINELFENDELVSAYKMLLEDNKEIDFESILDLSTELLTKNMFICQNIAGLIRSIHVDEYQDTNELQYNILSKIIAANTNINILFVGDINQAIYGSIGGIAKSITELEGMFGVDFEEKILNDCYRSSQRLIDYYSSFEIEPTNASSIARHKDKLGEITYDTKVNKVDLISEIVDIIRRQIESGDSQSEICILAPQWQSVYPLAKKLRELLPDINFDAPDVTPIKYNPLNVFFLISKLVFTQNSGHPFIRRREASMILEILSNDYNLSIKEEVTNLDVLQVINSTVISVEDGISVINNAIRNVLNLIEVSVDLRIEGDCKLFFEEINDRVSRYNLNVDYTGIEKTFKEKDGVVISTIHGVKGEEYKTVIAFSLLKGKLPHWNYIIEDELKLYKVAESQKLLYVLCSRSKLNLHLYSEIGHFTNSGNLYSPTEELVALDFRYDNI